MKIIVVDDNDTFRSSLIHYLTFKLGNDVIADFHNPIDLLKSKIKFKADIMLLDIEMPEMNGIYLAKKLLDHDRRYRLMAITNYQEKIYLDQLVYAGFKGCVFKNDLFSQLEKALTKVKNNGIFFPDNIQDEITMF